MSIYLSTYKWTCFIFSEFKTNNTEHVPAFFPTTGVVTGAVMAASSPFGDGTALNWNSFKVS